MALSPPQHQNASLYVGDLPPDVTEAMLFDLFKAVGPVLSIRVCRDAVTRRSLSYAYVNFQSAHDAERALETLNYHQINGKPIRIMWSHRDPSLRKSGAGNVFIKNLHKTIDNQTLYDTFSQFGNILSCKVATGADGESRGYGFVHFESDESAKAAIEKVNGMLLKSLQVYVGRFVRRSQRMQLSALRYTNVYLKDLKQGITQDEIVSYLSKFGPIKSTCLKTDKRDRPFAFVDFETHEAAAEAVEQCSGKEIAELTETGSFLYIQRAQKKSERQEELKKKFAQLKARRINEYSGSNLYVKNLDDTVDDQQLKEIFEKFGEITSCKVMQDDKVPPGSKGFGFVCFKEVESANKAISEMNGFLLGAKPLYVNVAQRKEVRRATLEIQYAARVARMPTAAGAMGNPSSQQQPGMNFQPMYHPPPGYFPPGPPGPAYMGYPPQPSRGGMMGPKWQQGMPGMGPFPPPNMQGGPQMGIRGGPAPRGGRMGARGSPQAGRGAPVQGRGLPKAAPGMAPPSSMMFKQGMQTPMGMGMNGREPLTAAGLANMNPDQQKNALGERLFARISETHPEYAAKITGMLLEMDVPETLNLLESPDVLHSKITEALEVLKAHMVEEQATNP
eukprot:NODE_235_length_2623_cov_44.191106_g220_i0.p1 GENE.NODE_235_length_2623_cov_44.191106_g220_i0~~NODE_235_length_2623_cov_44.191106_g220_i0.p1  ORF type:complete len:618 (-),score=114.61 NODE_235_length_2623_cov_44.191106_g220_i0:671-2524(-)